MSAKTAPPRPTEVMDKPEARAGISKWGLGVGALVVAVVLVVVVGMVLRAQQQNPPDVVGVLPTQMLLPTIAPTLVPPTEVTQPTDVPATQTSLTTDVPPPTQVALVVPATLPAPTTAPLASSFDSSSPQALAIYAAPMPEFVATLAPVRLPPAPPQGGGPSGGGGGGPNNNQPGGQGTSNDGQSPMQVSYEYVADGLEAVERGDMEAALSFLEQAVSADSRYRPALYMRAQMYAASGRTAEAETEYDALISGDDGRFPYPYFGRGQIEYVNGDYVAAIDDYTQTLQRDPNYGYAYYARGLAYMQTGEYENAAADFDQALRLEPNAAYVYGQRANARLLSGDFAGAAGDYTAALNSDSSAALYVGRGDAAVALGDVEAALADFQQALCLDANLTYASQRITELGGTAQAANCAS